MTANVTAFAANAATPIIGATSITSNVAFPAGRAIQIAATVQGTATVTLQDGSTLVINPAVGDNIYPYAATKVVTGTATIANMYCLR